MSDPVGLLQEQRADLYALCEKADLLREQGSYPAAELLYKEAFAHPASDEQEFAATANSLGSLKIEEYQIINK